jgi:histidyl-tRNA synthetase
MKKHPYRFRLAFLWLVLLTFVLLPPSALAVSPTPTTHQQLMQTYQQKRLDSLRQRSLVQIDTRLTSLNKLSLKVSSLKWLSSSQKNNFISDITTNINNLTTLRNKIVADTDIATLEADNKSIFATYRIFAVFEPRLNILSQADSKLARINSRLSKLTDQSSITKLNQAKELCNQAITAVSPLTPEGYPGNLTLLKSARSNLKNAEALIRGVN